MRVEKLAVFAHVDGFLERRSALRETLGPLQRFVMEDESIRSLPETDWDILGGPAEIVAEHRLPLEFVRELLAKELIRTVTVPAP